MTVGAAGAEHATAPHLVSMGATAWALWRDAALRSTGFPASLLDGLRDPTLGRAADKANAAAAVSCFAREYESACARQSGALRDIAAAARFREAVAWQNPDVVRHCLDKVVAAEPRNSRGRAHELTVASYVQRYALKNDTVGFFGPVGWSQVTADDCGLYVRPGHRLVRRQSVHLEVWAVDEVGRAVARQPGMLAWLTPRLPTGLALDGAMLHRPRQQPIALDESEAMLLARRASQIPDRGANKVLVWNGGCG